MMCYVMAPERIEIGTDVTEEMMESLYWFGKSTRPGVDREDYGPSGNTWFFDRENKLACVAGSYDSAELWYEHLRLNFFQPRGIDLPEKIRFAWDESKGFWELSAIRDGQYEQWEQRVKRISEREAEHRKLEEQKIAEAEARGEELGRARQLVRMLDKLLSRKRNLERVFLSCGVTEEEYEKAKELLRTTGAKKMGEEDLEWRW